MRPNSVGEVMRSCPRGLVAAPDAASSAAWSCARMCRASSRYARPTSVSRIRLVVRVKSRAPSRSSSALTPLVADGALRPSAFAPAVKLPASATAMNTSRVRRRSTVCQVYCDRFGGRVVREAEGLVEIELCGVNFSFRQRKPRRRGNADWVGEASNRVRADSTVVVLTPEDYDRLAERIRRTGTPPFEFACAPAYRGVPGESPAHGFGVRDGNGYHTQLARPPGC